MVLQTNLILPFCQSDPCWSYLVFCQALLNLLYHLSDPAYSLLLLVRPCLFSSPIGQTLFILSPCWSYSVLLLVHLRLFSPPIGQTRLILSSYWSDPAGGGRKARALVWGGAEDCGAHPTCAATSSTCVSHPGLGLCHCYSGPRLRRRERGQQCVPRDWRTGGWGWGGCT